MSFKQFAASYRREMRSPDPRHVIATIAAVAQHQAIHLGCYCADETRCHRSVLLDLMLTAQKALPAGTPTEAIGVGQRACARIPERAQAR